jgi:hypothetical protein
MQIQALSPHLCVSNACPVEEQNGLDGDQGGSKRGEGKPNRPPAAKQMGVCCKFTVLGWQAPCRAAAERAALCSCYSTGCESTRPRQQLAAG